MTPEFAKIVDPLICNILINLRALLQRKDPDQGPSENNREVLNRSREAVEKAFLDSEKRMNSRDERLLEEWKSAKYAIAVWADEMFIGSVDPDAGEPWRNNPLEQLYFGTNEGAEQYFLQAKRTRGRCPNAFEVYFLGVMLGFRGFYGAREAEMRARENQLPVTISDWVKEAWRQVDPRGDDEDDKPDRRALGPCEPMVAFRNLMAVTLLTLVMLAMTMVTWFFAVSRSE